MILGLTKSTKATTKNRNEYSEDVVVVTPKMAAEWLAETNHQNRAISTAAVKRYAQDICDGRWIGKNNPQNAIIFDKNGILIDGQQRLAAIILAEKAIELRVCRGADPRLKLVIDGGRPRSNVDQLRMAGTHGEIGVCQLAVLRAMLAGQSQHWTRKSAQVEGDLFKLHSEAVGFAIQALPRPGHKQLNGIANAITRAVIARAFYSQDNGLLCEFGEMLSTGIVMSKGDAVIVYLRNFLMTNINNGWVMRQEKYGKTERALVAYIRGESLAKLYSATEEYFPLPGEK